MSLPFEFSGSICNASEIYFGFTGCNASPVYWLHQWFDYPTDNMAHRGVSNLLIFSPISITESEYLHAHGIWCFISWSHIWGIIMRVNYLSATRYGIYHKTLQMLIDFEHTIWRLILHQLYSSILQWYFYTEVTGSLRHFRYIS